MKTRRKLPRKTFSQERFEILIKRQKEGRATFSELTELDEIVNRDPEIRDRVIRDSLVIRDDETPTGSSFPHKVDDESKAGRSGISGIARKILSYFKDRLRPNKFAAAAIPLIYRLNFSATKLIYSRRRDMRQRVFCYLGWF